MPVPNAQLKRELFSTLMAAVRDNDVAAVDRWLDPNADHANVRRTLLRASNDAQQTPLMAAAALGREALVDRLLNVDPSLARQTVQGMTALHLVTQSLSVQTLQRLLPFSDPSVRDANGMTALMLAARQGLDEFLAPLLAVSDPMVVDEHGCNALILAALHGWPRAVVQIAQRAPESARQRSWRGTAFQIMAYEVDHHTDDPAERFRALDHLATLDPNPGLVQRTLQRYGIEHFPIWRAAREGQTLREAFTDHARSDAGPTIKDRVRL